MKVPRHATITLLFLLPAASLATECAQFKEGSTSRATCESAQGFESVDKSLNSTYQKALSAYKKPDWSKELQSLIAAQRAWLTFRDRHCEFVQQLAGGAGASNLLDCKTDLTRERTEFLNRLIEDSR